MKITIEATSAKAVKNELEQVAKYIQDLCNDYPDINMDEIEVVIKSDVILHWSQYMLLMNHEI